MYPTRRDAAQVPGCHYLDGVPVKIGETFRPPRKITLPLSYQQRYPVELLNEEYDFSLENQVLQLAETKRKGREASERARAEHLATTIEAFTRHGGETKLNGFASGTSEPSSDDTRDRSQDDDDTVEAESDDAEDSRVRGRRPQDDASSLLTSLEPNSMLLPVQTRRANASDKPDVTLTAANTLNLADFEAESSPFDSVALRSLNDIEELRSVLLNVQEGSGSGASFHHQNQHHPSATASMQAGVSSRSQYDHAGSDVPAPYDQQMSCSAPTQSSPAFAPIFAPSAHGHHSPANPDLANKGWSGHGRHHHGQEPGAAPPGATGTSSTVLPGPGEDNYAACVLVPIRNTRSTPDILKELGVVSPPVGGGWSDQDRRKVTAAVSGGQPQRPSSAGPTMLPDAAPVNAGPDKSNRPAKGEHGCRPRPASTAFESDPDARALIRHVTEMGFPKARVVRAVHKLGADDKKVVEHLCMLQTLIEQGYNGDDAECALFLNNHVVSQAKEYLDMLIQFRDLGFDDESIKRALLHCENNRDKALDFLVS